MFVFDHLHEAMLVMSSHQATKMRSNLRVRFESFAAEDLSYEKLAQVCMNYPESDWQGIVHHPIHCFEA
jgi:hypothetical protein